MANQDNNRKSNPIPYNGEPLQEGEVLVPMLVDQDFARSIEASGLRTWHKGGVYYAIIHVPVPREQEKISWQAFYADLNGFLDEQLGPNRYARCLLPREDGSVRPCPKETDGRYNACCGCPYRGMLEKEDRSMLSLETLSEENACPMKTESSAESEAMLGFLLGDLLAALEQINPAYGQIIRLGYEGCSTKEIVSRMPQGKSQAYQMIRECRRRAEEFLRG